MRRWLFVALVSSALFAGGCGGSNSADVPNVAGQPTGQARVAVQDAGATVRFVGGTPSDDATCKVTTQSKVGDVDKGTQIKLDYFCPLTVSDIHERADDQSSEPGEIYSIGACTVTSEREGQCDVEYDSPNGVICNGQIFVTLESNNSTIASRQHVTC